MPEIEITIRVPDLTVIARGEDQTADFHRVLAGAICAADGGGELCRPEYALAYAVHVLADRHDPLPADLFGQLLANASAAFTTAAIGLIAAWEDHDNRKPQPQEEP